MNNLTCTKHEHCEKCERCHECERQCVMADAKFLRDLGKQLAIGSTTATELEEKTLTTVVLRLSVIASELEILAGEEEAQPDRGTRADYLKSELVH